MLYFMLCHENTTRDFSIRSFAAGAPKHTGNGAGGYNGAASEVLVSNGLDAVENGECGLTSKNEREPKKCSESEPLKDLNQLLFSCDPLALGSRFAHPTLSPLDPPGPSVVGLD